VLDWLVKDLDKKGTLDLVRHGLKLYGKTIRLAYFRPSHGLNPDVLALYEKNRLVVTRQARCNPDTEETIDMLLSLNGLRCGSLQIAPGVGVGGICVR